MRKIRLLIEYEGTRYSGWQFQTNQVSIQGVLESKLHKITKVETRVIGSGRTDAGVHAEGQVAHFLTSSTMTTGEFLKALNSLLPPDIVVKKVEEAKPDFHAQISATRKTYRYTILNRATRPGYQAGTLGWERVPLDAARMHEAAQVLVGEHDFSSFRSSECQANHAIRRILRVEVRRDQDRVIIEVAANGFLHNMVRILTGCLLAIGRGDRPVDWMGTLLTGRDRTAAGVTAPPHGLCFLQPAYPQEFGVPDFESSKTSPWHP